MVTLNVAVILLAGPIGLLWQDAGELLAGGYNVICHRVPTRCLAVMGMSMAVCARCFGLWLGIGTATWLCAWRRLRIPTAMALICITALSWLAPIIGTGVDTALARTLSGLLGGIGVTVCTGRAVAFVHGFMHRRARSFWGARSIAYRFRVALSQLRGGHC